VSVIEQERIFYVRGIPVTWHEINDWWTKLREKDKNKALSYGDPYFNEKTCWKIANHIVNEIEIKIHGHISNNYGGHEGYDEHNENPQPKKAESHAVQSLGDYVDVDWHDASAVFKKAMEDAERKYKEKTKLEEEERKAREYDKWRHEELLRRARDEKYNKQQTAPPPPIPEKPKDIPWRDVLKIPYGMRIEERMVKLYFRRQALVCHPDRGGSNKQMEELFRARDAAYRELGLPLP